MKNFIGHTQRVKKVLKVMLSTRHFISHLHINVNLIYPCILLIMVHLCNFMVRHRYDRCMPLLSFYIENPPIHFEYEVDDSSDNSIRCLLMNKLHGYLRNVIECRFDELLIYGGCLSLFIQFYKYDIHTIFTDDVIFVISKLCLCLSNLHISI